MSQNKAVLVRVLVTPILVLAFLSIVYFDFKNGSLLLTVLMVSAISSAVSYELLSAAKSSGMKVMRRLCIFPALFTVALFFTGNGMPVVVGFIVLVIIWTVTDFDAANLGDTFATVSLALYPALLGFVCEFDRILWVRPNLHTFLVYLFVASKLPDSFGYIFGKTLGRHKLCVKVSPNKTLEGAVAGFIGGVGGGLLIWYNTDLSVYFIGTPVFAIAAATSIITLTSMLGDLAKSCIKRWAGVKHSSDLLPEFGGITDMVDSFILSVPVAYVIFSYGDIWR